MKRIDTRGISHVLLPLLVMVVIGIVGSYFIIGSHADSIKPNPDQQTTTKTVKLVVKASSKNRGLACEQWMSLEVVTPVNWTKVASGKRDFANSCKGSKSYTGVYNINVRIPAKLKAHRYVLTTQEVSKPTVSEQRAGYIEDSKGSCTSEISSPIFNKPKSTYNLSLDVLGNSSDVAMSC